MKKCKKMFLSVLTIGMLSTLLAMNVMAAEPYTYTVNLYAGNMGTVDGGSVVKLTDLALGTEVRLDNVSIQVADDKYYVKGVRLSGRDNSPMFSGYRFMVKKDVDYVVAYGIIANRVAYTVNYQDVDGNTLSPSKTLYGDIGDKPVVAYEYIENYVPQALALTGTLSANEAENVFTFTYTPGEDGTVTTETTVVTVLVPGTTTTTTTEVVDGTTGTTGTAGTTGTTGTNAATATTTDAGATSAAAAGNAAATDNNAAGTVTSPDEGTPQGLVDLDEEETPASDIKLDEKTGFPIAIGIAIGAVALIGVVAFLLIRKRRHAK